MLQSGGGVLLRLKVFVPNRDSQLLNIGSHRDFPGVGLPRIHLYV